jgi:hypothetical protein
MIPKIESIEQGFKLSLINSISDKILGEDVICDYLLFMLNKFKKFKYVKIYKLVGPVDTFEEFLNIVSSNNESLHLKISMGFLSNYRQGLFGSLTLDDIHI